MVYSQQNSKGRTYYLHAKNVRLRNGRTQRIFFFSPKEDQDEGLPEVPVSGPRHGSDDLDEAGPAPRPSSEKDESDDEETLSER